MAKHIIVGLSGGVDSAVSAWLLKNQGYKVTGLFMKNWEDDDDDEYCTSKQDLIDAVSVSEKIGIDIEVVNFAKEYKAAASRRACLRSVPNWASTSPGDTRMPSVAGRPVNTPATSNPRTLSDPALITPR